MQLPKRVTIELTNRCNRACEGCPRNKTSYPLGNMDWQLFTRIIEELPSYIVIVPFFRGESLIYPSFVDAMKQLQKFNEVQLATNGDYLKGQNEKVILETCTFLSYSLHKFQFPRNMKNLSFFYRALGNGIKTQVSILETLVPETKKEQFVKSWLNHVDRVRIYVEHSHNGFGDVKNKPQIHPDLPCNKPFEEMVVYWNGKVALCNHDWNREDGLADLNEVSIREAWNNEEYQKIRVKHGKGLRRQVESCQDCDFWMTSYLPKKMFGELHQNG